MLIRAQRGDVVRAQQKGPEPWPHYRGVEVAPESLACSVGHPQASGLIVEDAGEDSSGADGIMQGPEPSLDAIVAELGDASRIASDDGKTGGHRLDDRQPKWLSAGGVDVCTIRRQQLAHVGPEATESYLFLNTERAGVPQEILPK